MGPLVTSYTLLLQGLPGQGGHGQTLTGLGSRPTKGVLSVLRWISMRGCWTKKFGPLVFTVPLEFSRLPAMLSPLKTTLFPVPALTPRRQIGECTHCSTLEDMIVKKNRISLNASKLSRWPVDIKNRAEDGFRLS